jgi:hypothetical protein
MMIARLVIYSLSTNTITHANVASPNSTRGTTISQVDTSADSGGTTNNAINPDNARTPAANANTLANRLNTTPATANPMPATSHNPPPAIPIMTPAITNAPQAVDLGSQLGNNPTCRDVVFQSTPVVKAAANAQPAQM